METSTTDSQRKLLSDFFNILTKKYSLTMETMLPEATTDLALDKAVATASLVSLKACCSGVSFKRDSAVRCVLVARLNELCSGVSFKRDSAVRCVLVARLNELCSGVSFKREAAVDSAFLACLKVRGAGSGKSFILKTLVHHIRRCYAPTVDQLLNASFVEVTAPTGVAARLVNGKTLHSAFSLGIEKGRATLQTNVRQQNDSQFIDILNNLRVGELSMEQYEILLERSRVPLAGDFADGNAVQIFPTIKLVNNYNDKMVELMADSVKIYTVNAHDESKEPATYGQKPNHVSIPQDPNCTGGLLSSIKIAIGARVMLRVNLKVSEGLVNGSMGVIKKIEWHGLRRDQLEEGELPKTIFIKFDDESIGKSSKDENGLIPIQPHSIIFQVGDGKTSLNIGVRGASTEISICSLLDSVELSSKLRPSSEDASEGGSEVSGEGGIYTLVSSSDEELPSEQAFFSGTKAKILCERIIQKRSAAHNYRSMHPGIFSDKGIFVVRFSMDVRERCKGNCLLENGTAEYINRWGVTKFINLMQFNRHFQGVLSSKLVSFGITLFIDKLSGVTTKDCDHDATYIFKNKSRQMSDLSGSPKSKRQTSAIPESFVFVTTRAKPLVDARYIQKAGLWRRSRRKLFAPIAGARMTKLTTMFSTGERDTIDTEKTFLSEKITEHSGSQREKYS
ncbi:hypothetical protein HW555_013236 [Spodoptera exigua]|uniref:ATP-dependent DNA helicase n=1 Tax=Spodoptera exigua TaxID=7107 RepID=A0A835KX68_SPOEX|nr:hypothetical protein HW555_013236 [Spodoptera exigua]